MAAKHTNKFHPGQGLSFGVARIQAVECQQQVDILPSSKEVIQGPELRAVAQRVEVLQPMVCEGK